MLIGPAGSGKSTLLEQIACELQLPYYAMSVNEIESRTGLDLFANLPNSIEETVENNDNWQTFQNF